MKVSETHAGRAPSGVSGEANWQTMNKSLAVVLCLVTFFEFVVFGAWFSTLGLVLHTHGLASIIGDAYFISAIAAILSPVLLGAVCDRFMPPRIVLSLVHLTGAGLMFALPGLVLTGDSTMTLLFIFLYMLAFQPTLGMINSISLKLLGEHQTLFPYIRMFGPLGWVVVGQFIGFYGLSASTDTFYVAAISGVVMALLAFTLPHTPPPAAGEPFSWSRAFGFGALSLFKNRQFSVLMICVLLTSILLGFYNTFSATYLGALGIENVAGVLSFGQLTEVIFIGIIPWALIRYGVKKAMLFGMCMWVARFILFVTAAHEHTWAAIGGVFLHGLCNDFVIVIAAMFIARLAPAELAAQAQGLLILMVSGIGAAVGSFTSGQIFQRTVATGNASADWIPLWSVPIVLAVLAAIIWALFFKETDAYQSDDSHP